MACHVASIGLSGEEALDMSDGGVIQGLDESSGGEELSSVLGWEKVFCWLLGYLLSDVMSPCKVKLSLLVPVSGTGNIGISAADGLPCLVFIAGTSVSELF